MDLSRIRKFVKQNGDKFIFVENGEPEVVMMSFREYEKLSGVGFVGLAQEGRSEHEERVPFDGLERESAVAEQRKTDFGVPASIRDESVGLPVRLEDVRLEDLPL